jgi:hypothetical protein
MENERHRVAEKEAAARHATDAGRLRMPNANRRLNERQAKLIPMLLSRTIGC